jgi:hypothetical protein
MSDIMSRIKLQVEGADQSVREIQKLKGAYDEVSDSAKGISGGVSADPFEKAVSSAPAGGAGTAGRSEHNDLMDRANDRLASHYNTAGAMGSQVPGAINTASSAISQIGSGQGASGAGSAMGGLARMIGAGTTGGLIAMAGSAVLGGIGALSGEEKELVQQLHGTGLSTRLDAGYSNMRNSMIGFGQAGVASQRLSTLMQSLASSGGQFTAGTWNTVKEATQYMEYLGLPPETIGQFLGTQQQAGYTGTVNKQIYATAYQTFGRGMADSYMSELTRMQNQSLSLTQKRGVGAEQDILLSNANLLGTLATGGGMSAQGAVAVMQQAESAGRASATLSRPEDVVAYQAMKKLYPNKSMTELMMYMESHPIEVSNAVAGYISDTSGNADVARLRMKQYLGGNVSQADAYMKANAQMEREGVVPGSARATEILAEAGAVAQEGMQATAIDQSKLFEGLQKAAYDISQMFIKLFKGDEVTIEGLEFGMTPKQFEEQQFWNEKYIDQFRNPERITASELWIDKMITSARVSESGKQEITDIWAKVLPQLPSGASLTDFADSNYEFNAGAPGTINNLPGLYQAIYTNLSDWESNSQERFNEIVKEKFAPYIDLKTRGNLDASYDIIQLIDKKFGGEMDLATEKEMFLVLMRLLVDSFDQLKGEMEKSNQILFMDEEPQFQSFK